MSGPTIGLNMICAPDRAKELDRCLSSIAPHVDEVVVVITGSVRAAMRKVLQRHHARHFRFNWRDDFAVARNFALSKSTTDWWMWCDSDDEIEGADQLRSIVAELPEEIGGLWATYIYATDKHGHPATVHERERIMRRDVGWHWEGRLHESVLPDRFCDWRREENVVWHHYSSSPAGHHERNIRILEQWVKDEPGNIRIWSYLGNQFFAHEEWRRAALWYDRFWTFSHEGRRGSDSDRWMAMCFSARSHRNFQDWPGAIRADMAAITEYPLYADPYIGMADVMVRMGQWKEAISWGETSTHKLPSSEFATAFANPLNYTWWLWTVMNVAYAAEGRIQDAIEACEIGLQAMPEDEDLLHNLAVYKESLPIDAEVKAYQVLGLKDPLGLKEQLSEDAQVTKRAREVWMPALLKESQLGTQPIVSVFCGETVSDFTPLTATQRGIGGSETAVVEAMRRLAQEGWKPIVYNNPGADEGEYGGVVYSSWERWRPRTPVDLFISWRRPEMVLERPVAKESWLWCHDLNQRDRIREETIEGYSKVMAVSDWHRSYLARLYPFIPADKLGVLPNGINLDRFEQEHGPPQHARAVYCSSPDRGLVHLLRMWPVIRQTEPEAELHVFYGFDNMEAWGQAREAAFIKQLADQPGVELRGSVDQWTLAKEMLEADLWLYPTSFLETSCITALEAMAADLKIVATACGNIPGHVGDAGLLIPGLAPTETYQAGFLGLAFSMIMDFNTRMEYSGRGPARVPEFTWNKAMEKWREMLGGGLNLEPGLTKSKELVRV